MKRTDAIQLGAPIKTATGTTFEARVASTAPMPYDDGSGRPRIEQRDLGEMREIVRQLAGKPITLQHPADGMISSGAKANIIGTIKSARLEGEHAIATLEVTDPAGLAAIQSGTRDISLGYSCGSTTDDVGRVWQTGITIDHCAVVDSGRCPTCELRADRRDCADACACRKGCATCGMAGCGFTTDDDIDNYDWSTGTYRANDDSTGESGEGEAMTIMAEDPDAPEREDDDTRADAPNENEQGEYESDTQHAQRMTTVRARAEFNRAATRTGMIRHTPQRRVDGYDDTDEEMAKARLRDATASAHRGTK